MNNLEEREEVKKEKASVASEKLKKKKMYPTLIENLEYSKWEDMVWASIYNMNIEEKRLETV